MVVTNLSVKSKGVTHASKMKCHVRMQKKRFIVFAVHTILIRINSYIMKPSVILGIFQAELQ